MCVAVLFGDGGILAVYWQRCEGHAQMGVWNLLKFSVRKGCKFHTNVTSSIFFYQFSLLSFIAALSGVVNNCKCQC